MDQFEEQISTLMNYQTGPGSPFTAADIAGGARRRGRQRVYTATASALAVAAVGVGAVTLAGNGAPRGSALAAGSGGATQPVATSASSAEASPTGAATPTGPASTAAAVSPVKTVKPGEKFEIVSGLQGSVTASKKCDYVGSPYAGLPPGSEPMTQCRDVDGGNFGPHDQPTIDTQGYGDKGTQVLFGEYLGPAVPSLLDVVQEGKHYAATIVQTAGQDKWMAWYAVLPAPEHGRTVSGMPAITAYDAAGKVLADTPPVLWAPSSSPGDPATPQGK